MEEYWKALITGLTPQKPSDTGLWWKLPLCIFAAFAFFALF